MLIPVLVACVAFCQSGAQEVAGNFACSSGVQHVDICGDGHELPCEDARCAGHFAMLQHATGISRLEMPTGGFDGSKTGKVSTPLLQSGTDTILSNRTPTLQQDERLDAVLAKMQKMNVPSRLMTQVKTSTHPLGANIDEKTFSRTLLTTNFTKKEEEEGFVHVQSFEEEAAERSVKRQMSGSTKKKEEEGFVHEQDAAEEFAKTSLNRQISGPTKKGEEGPVHEEDVAEETTKKSHDDSELKAEAKAWRQKQTFIGACFLPVIFLLLACSSNPFSVAEAPHASDDRDYWGSTDWQAA